MLHEAPLCMGIAHDGAALSRGVAGGTEYRNVYWAYDGGHRQLVRFDFESDHGPGSMDHSLANVRRYAGLELGYVAGTTSHMELDATSRELFVADTGNDRVLRVMVDTGNYLQDAKVLFPIYSSPEASFNYTIWEGLQWSVLGVLDRPSALALATDVLYVGSDTLGEITAFDRATGVVLKSVKVVTTPDRLRGISLSPADGALHLARSRPSGGGEVARLRVDAVAMCTGSRAQSAGCQDGAKGAGEADVDCGGALCARCALGRTCAEGSDCASGRCQSGVCTASASDHGRTAEYLYPYLDSARHRESFAHHMLNGAMGGASYLNPYPIMNASFCETVGINASTGELECGRIDYDSLLLGGCWCHACLPVNPCRNGGKCVNYQKQGYTCDCAATGFGGDHCHVPRSPPSTPPPSTATVVLTFTASGSVGDYSDTSSLQQKIATAAGVDKSLVTIQVTAASVRITATIAVPASMTADQVQTSLSSSLGTIDDASTALGVTVEEAPTVALSSPPAAPPSDVADGSSGGIDSALIIGPVLGGAALLALAATAALMCRGSASRARARSTAPAAAPVKPVATALDAPSLSMSPVIASTPDAKSAVA